MPSQIHFLSLSFTLSLSLTLSFSLSFFIFVFLSSSLYFSLILSFFLFLDVFFFLLPISLSLSLFLFHTIYIRSLFKNEIQFFVQQCHPHCLFRIPKKVFCQFFSRRRARVCQSHQRIWVLQETELTKEIFMSKKFPSKLFFFIVFETLRLHAPTYLPRYFCNHN